METSPIYLDHHATTACHPDVVAAMLPFFTVDFGNAASRTHAWGERARRAVEVARRQVAELINVSPKEIIWTSGATESNNLAIAGAAAHAGSGHIITVTTEHKAVLDTCADLEKRGFDVTRLPVDSDGLLDVQDVANAIRTNTTLVSVMTANNEIGVLSPIRAIGAICREHGVLFHSDAAQAAGKVPLDARRDGLDLLSLTAHKMYGPKGIGALLVRRGRPPVRLNALIHGGGHERGMRSGTLPVPLIVGMGKAAEIAMADLANDEPRRLKHLRDRLLALLRAKVDGVTVNGSLEHRLPHNLNVSIDGVEAEALMMGVREIAVSSGSACSSATLEPSYVLRALGISPQRAHESIRFGLGRTTTASQVEYAARRFGEKALELRALTASED
jgi:cysteine desulfurase